MKTSKSLTGCSMRSLNTLQVIEIGTWEENPMSHKLPRCVNGLKMYLNKSKVLTTRSQIRLDRKSKILFMFWKKYRYMMLLNQTYKLSIMLLKLKKGFFTWLELEL